ncbi:hypothetical protein [Thioalkalivibrio sp.]|uniref:hypothetical protein n=1 Tax=Thioalkalivibrio sp. TaxID=2093813 RepID=UPI0025F85AFE|nr:hypothetical protein [Thioalkalivibrio sp.]
MLILVFLVISHDALSLSQERFYADYQFADMFAEVTRAPRRHQNASARGGSRVPR